MQHARASGAAAGHLVSVACLVGGLLLLPAPVYADSPCGAGLTPQGTPQVVPPGVAPPRRATATAPPPDPTSSPSLPGATEDTTQAAATTTPRPATAATLEELRGLTRELVAELRQIDQDLVEAAAKLRQAEDELAEVTAQTQVLEAELAARQAAVDQRAAAYGARLRALYKFTRTSPLEEILSAQDFGDALRRLTMIQAIMRVDHRLLGQLRAERDAVLEVTNTLREQQRRAAALRDEIDHQHEVLLARQADQAAAVARAQAEQSEVEAALFHQQAGALAANIVALQAQYQQELVALERQRAPSSQAPIFPAVRPAPGQRAGASAGPTGVQVGRLPSSVPALAWPVVNPVVTTEYGEPTFAQIAHSGIDLAQRLHTPVLAAADGIVIACGLAVPGDATQSYGMLVVIAHDRILATLYAHLDDETQGPPVKVGDHVKRGQLIGYIGMTGMTTGPHLHFEVRVAGQTQEPRESIGS
ncbi:MAG: murein hydrolase activator EnvC family protein [Chloroflexota bacterium]